MAPNIANKAQRLRDNRELRAKAPVAAQFEDSSQTAAQLSEALEALEANRPDSAELRTLAQTCKDRLKSWGDDCGATSRRLDHALRSSPRLKGHTIHLLQELDSFLHQTINQTREQDPEDEDADEPPPEGDVADVAGAPKADVAPDDNADSSPEKCLEEALEVVSYLYKLIPMLLDPLEEYLEPNPADLDSYSRDKYKQIAKEMFPGAPSALVERLGEANRRRRQNVRRSRRRLLKASGSERRVARTVSRRPVLTEQHWAHGADTLPTQLSEKESYSYSEAEVGASIETSVFDAKRNTANITSASTIDSHPMAQLLVPIPPINLETMDDTTEPFDCPFCHIELPLVTAHKMDVHDWTSHFFLDLQPHMCTAVDCRFRIKTHGHKTDWFQHELNTHRSQVVWFCGSCQKDFENEESFIDHLTASHGDILPDNPSLMAAGCRRYSLKPLTAQRCELCRESFDDMNQLEAHISSHLETFAIAATLSNHTSAEDPVYTTEKVQEFLDELPIDEARMVGTSVAGDRTVLARSLGLPGDGAMETVTGINDDDEGARSVDNNQNSYKGKVEEYFDDIAEAKSAETFRSNVPPKDEGFVGRQESLRKIHKHLSKPGRVCCVVGRPGIGKSATALQYSYLYDQEYDYVFWIEAEYAGVCQQKYNMIASCFLDEGEKFPDENTYTFKVKEWMSQNDQRWLLIFDNATAWTDIARYIPRTFSSSKGSVLVTSRSSMKVPTSQHTLHLQLTVWDLDSSCKFLLQSIQPKVASQNLEDYDEHDEAVKIVEVVKRLPLALSVVVGHVNVSRISLRDFSEIWDEKEIRDKQRAKANPLQTSADPIIDSLWDISIKEVQTNCRELLNILSFLDPDNIRESLLFGDHEEEYLDFLDQAEALSYKRMVDRLRGRRLINIKDAGDGETAYGIHRLLQQRVLLDMDDYNYANALRRAFRLLRKQLPRADSQQVPDPAELDRSMSVMNHVYTFFRVLEKRPPKSSMVEPQLRELAEFFYDAGFYMWSRQTHAYDGLSILEAAERILDRTGADANDKIRADIHCMIGLLLLDLGCEDRVQGSTRLYQALQIRKVIFSELATDDNEVLRQNAANDYALCLMNEHRFEEARLIYQELLQQYEKWGGEPKNPFEYGKYYCNTSILLLAEGKIDEAKRSVTRSLELTEKFSGKKGLYYRRAFLLACVLLQAGEVQAALEMHLDALNERQEIHGMQHEHTILSTYAVGAMYHYLGRPAKAIEYINQCIEYGTNARWSKEALARARFHLAVLYEEQKIEEEKVEGLKEAARMVLAESKDYWPACLRDAVEDEMILFDNLLPTFQGRYTGRGLLRHIREKCHDGDGCL